MQFASLGSGSRGNATVIKSADCCVVVDCGFSLTETKRRLASINIAVEQIDALLVTHEHSDHSAGVATLAKRHSIPVYATHGTQQKLKLENEAMHAGLAERIDNIVIPSEDITEMRDGKKRSRTKIMFPGYMLVHMV